MERSGLGAGPDLQIHKLKRGDRDGEKYPQGPQASIGDATLANADGEGGACYIKIIREHSITTVCHQASLVGCNRIVSQVRDAVRSSWEIGERCNPLRETSVRR